VFVAASHFTAQLRNHLSRVEHRFVLINRKLARFTLRHGDAARTRTTCLVHGVDQDFFDDLNLGQTVRA